MDDAQAIRCLKSGDIRGLETLVARYQGKAVRVAYLITHDESAAEDITQDTFLRLFNRIDRFDEQRSFEPYLLRSVMNAALDHATRQKRSLSLEANLDTLDALLEQAASVETQVEYSQLRHEILSALSQLSPRQRAAVIGRYYLDMNEQEMTQALDAPRGTVKWLLNAARTRLRSLLVPERRLE
jgi:RNA polymerase sigma-70 factor, ECF subfamily